MRPHNTWPGAVTLLAVAAFCICAQHAAAQGGSQFTVQGAGVRVLFPPGYRSQPISMALADFGKPLYGGSLTGRLVYLSERADVAPDGKSHRCPGRACEFACEKYSDATPPFDISKRPGQFLIMLVDRGPSLDNQACYFLSKAYNAQLAGADAVLVADDRDGPLTTAIAPEEESVAHLLKDLQISAALITKSDGDLLKKLLKDQGQVTLALNWTNLEPRAQMVKWELWGSTNDECGTLCDQQAAFVRAMRPWATQLEKQGLAQFAPHYVLWSCPPMYQDSVECVNECIMNGTYCAPDPDGSLADGYSGINVLNMNLIHLCFAQVARAAGSPWLWWDFSEGFSTNCTTKQQKYTYDCAAELFTASGYNSLLGGTGRQAWDACIASGDPTIAPGNYTLDVFEKELDQQMGGADVAQVSILPTLRINGQQYRGSLDVSGVMRAICAGFPLGSEPPVCNEKWVSEDECEAEGEGWTKCRVGDANAQGRTRCVNTFDSYRCECGQGWVRSITSDGKEVCEDLNECLATNVAITEKDCACERCACVNTIGSYKCTGPMDNMCSAEHSYGGCWHSVVEGKVQHACVDTFSDYRRLAARGTVVDKWYKCACPACFAANNAPSPNPTCTAQCPLAQCQAGVCTAPGGGGGGVPAGGSGGSGGTPRNGVSGWGVMLIVLITAGLTVGLMYGMYHYVLRQRMQGEIRDIMSQYMPLDGGAGGNRGNARRGPGGGAAYASLSAVEEADEEHAPLVVPAGLPNSSSTRPAGPPASTPASGAPQPFLTQQQRTAFGSVAVPPQAGEGFATAPSYKPPAPLGETGSNGEAPARGSGGGADTKPVTTEPPLLPDGPL